MKSDRIGQTGKKYPQKIVGLQYNLSERTAKPIKYIVAVCDNYPGLTKVTITSKDKS